MRSTALAAAALACSACAATRFQLPMTSAELSRHGTATALVTYLGQPDAGPGVCEAGSEAAGLASAPGLGSALVAGLRERRVAPPVWAGCVERLLPGLGAAAAVDLVTRLLRAEADLLADRALEEDAGLWAQLVALHRVYLERAPGVAPPPQLLDAVEAELAPRIPEPRNLTRPHLGPVAAPVAAELVETVGLERGSWRGRRVDAALLDELAGRVDVGSLERCARRLPEAGLRAEAERRLVRLRVAGSPFPEVRDAAGEAVESVLRLGRNPISTEEHEPRRASLDPAAVPSRRILVRQRPFEGTATLLGVAPDRPVPSILPEVPLRGALEVELAGLSRPVTLCAPGRPLDPTPCILPSELELPSPMARLGPAGEVRLSEQVASGTAVDLARGGSRLEVPIRVAGRALAGLAWPVSFERPPDLVLEGPAPGGPGPDLAVAVLRLDPGHLHWSIAGAGQTLQAIVELADVASFRVVSRGGRGAAGADGSGGSDGFPGTSGTSASCPSSPGGAGSPGGDGGSGGAGGPGGQGGRGGEVRVGVSAPADLLAETLALARAAAASEGGPGGPGGRGGRGGSGGRGGAGGMGTTCTSFDGPTVFLPSGSDGASGRDGASGPDGAPGPAGPPGSVRVEVAP